MPNVSLSSDVFGNGTLANLSNDAGAIGYLSADTTAGSYNSAVFYGFGNQQQVTIAGTAMASSIATVNLGGDDARLTVLDSGQVSNTSFYATPAVMMGSPGATVVNMGTISGATGVELRHGYETLGRASQVINHGTISGNGFGEEGNQYTTAGFGAGIFIDSSYYIEESPERDPVSIVNTGLISGAYREAGIAPGYAILIGSQLQYGDDMVEESEMSGVAVQVVNSGEIMGRIKLLSQDDVVENSGEIHGDVVMGMGDDRVDSRGGEVLGWVYGNDGDDTLYGGEHIDAISGGGDDDRILGFDGADELYGASGDDTIRGGGGADTIRGESGSDEIHGGSGNDDIDGGSSGDDIRSGSGDDTVVGGTGDDTIDGGSGEENIDGGLGDDLIYGRSGDDVLRGDEGDDQIGGGAGDDTIAGNAGSDSIDGGSGGDRIFAGSDNDTAEGTLGDDYINGGSGDDMLYGGSDNDTLVGGSGADTLSGGNGVDTFVFSSVSDSPHAGPRDVITDFEAGVDMIDLTGFGGLDYVGSYTGAGNEVRYNGGVGRLYIDIDGDMASDFSVDLTGTPALTADDLIL